MPSARQLHQVTRFQAWENMQIRFLLLNIHFCLPFKLFKVFITLLNICRCRVNYIFFPLQEYIAWSVFHGIGSIKVGVRLNSWDFNYLVRWLEQNKDLTAVCAWLCDTWFKGKGLKTEFSKAEVGCASYRNGAALCIVMLKMLKPDDSNQKFCSV